MRRDVLRSPCAVYGGRVKALILQVGSNHNSDLLRPVLGRACVVAVLILV